MKYVSQIIAALASLFLVSPAYTSDLVPFTSGSSFYGSLGTGQINIDTNGRFLINDDSEIVGALVAKQFGAQGKDKYTIAIGEALQSFSLSKYPNCDSKGCLFSCLAVDGCSLKPFPIDDIFGMNVYSSESVNPPGCKRTDCETIIEEYPCPTEKEPSKTCTRSRVKCQ